VRCAMVERGDSLREIEAHLSIYRAIREGRLASVADTVERILGGQPISFDRWIQENIATFTGHTHVSSDIEEINPRPKTADSLETEQRDS
jgi:hypothetical protein